jgi:hypothetical protein
VKTVRCHHQNYNDICTIINKLKFNKAAGSDNTHPEMIKNGRKTLKHKRHKLIWNIRDKEHLPTQWNEGVIWPIDKMETE